MFDLCRLAQTVLETRLGNVKFYISVTQSGFLRNHIYLFKVDVVWCMQNCIEFGIGSRSLWQHV